MFGRALLSYASGPNAFSGRQPQGLSKVCDRTRPKILKAQQRFVGCFADLADRREARGRQHIPDACGKSNVFDPRVVGQLWRRID
jgi:hypothetical protein